MKKYGSRNAKDRVAKNTVRKILNMPFCAYRVQISTTLLESVMLAFSTPSSLMFFLMNSTARYAPVVTAWQLAREPVDHGAARDQSEQKRCMHQAEHIHVSGETARQRHNG